MGLLDSLLDILLGTNGWIVNAAFLYITYVVFVLLSGLPFIFQLESLTFCLAYLFLYFFGMKDWSNIQSVETDLVNCDSSRDFCDKMAKMTSKAASKTAEMALRRHRMAPR